jgi:5'-3' exonuclease
MDCNSIVYDAYREIEEKYKKEPFDTSTIEHKLIQLTITKIVEYIELISPSKCVYITFDGVAPFAKMDQQRTRRYKTQFTNHIPLWNTTAITPGTPFMTDLSKAIRSFFIGTQYKYKFTETKFMISCSDEPGEGEHKLFHYLRNIDATKDFVAVYGLDADLIMLSLFHCEQTKNIFVFREAPTFKTVISGHYSPKELLFMDISALTTSIFQEMGNYHANDKSIRVTDYVFMCFLLGNDFLPHFPSLNIRTHGIQILTDTYYQTIGRFSNRSFILNQSIQWNYVLLFITELAKQEHNYLKKEMDERNKWERSSWPTKTPLEKENYMLNLPVIFRTDEQYIYPHEYGWEQRYYRRLLDISSQDEIKNVCINYLQGLEWVFHYYTSDCIHWRWKYSYSYPPLLSDLVKYIPNKQNIRFLLPQLQNPFHPTIQLAYVLPPSQHHLLPQALQQKLHVYSYLYPTEYMFQWAFCRYFWEAHPILPDIPLSLLDELSV